MVIDVVEIHYVKDTFAYRKGNDIYLHEDLKEYPELHRVILEHELKHTDTEKISLQDIMLDMTHTYPRKEMHEFRKKHFKIMLYMALPINKFGINYNLMIIYAILIALTWFTMRSVIWIAQNLIL